VFLILTKTKVMPVTKNGPYAQVNTSGTKV